MLFVSTSTFFGTNIQPLYKTPKKLSFTDFYLRADGLLVQLYVNGFVLELHL